MVIPARLSVYLVDENRGGVITGNYLVITFEVITFFIYHPAIAGPVGTPTTGATGATDRGVGFLPMSP